MLGLSEIVPEEKALAAKSDDQSWIFRTHIVGGKKINFHMFFS